MKIVFMRFYTRHNEQGCIETACIVKFKGSIDEGTLMGNAKQNPIDGHIEYLGRKVAFSRAMKKVIFKPTRKKLWQYFHKHFPNPSGGINV